MPLVEVTVASGRPQEQIRALIHELHLAVQNTVNANPESIHVVVREIPRGHWATGNRTVEEKDQRQPAGPADPGQNISADAGL
jgi:4-oxalocrotonate tautomerase